MVKRIGRTGALVIAVVVLVCLVWAVSEATGVEVGAGALVVFFVAMLATCLVLDFLLRRTTDARIASTIGAAGATAIAWAGVETMEVDIEAGVYIVMFASTFTAHYLWLRRMRHRARRTSASPQR